jgi:hypothetical protein
MRYIRSKRKTPPSRQRSLADDPLLTRSTKIMVGDEKSRIADMQKADDGDETRDFLREILVELKGVAALLKRRDGEEPGNEEETGGGETVKCEAKVGFCCW